MAIQYLLTFLFLRALVARFPEKRILPFLAISLIGTPFTLLGSVSVFDVVSQDHNGIHTRVAGSAAPALSTHHLPTGWYGSGSTTSLAGRNDRGACIG